MRLPDGRIRKRRRAEFDERAAHELTFTCYRRLKLLSRDRTRAWMIAALDGTRRRFGLDLWAYVVMPEHVHLLVAPRGEYPGPGILQSLKQPVARKALDWLAANQPAWLPRLTARDGRRRFWQPGGGYDRSLSGLGAIKSAIDYIHANPARRGLVERPTDWAWSSARFYEGGGEVLLAMDEPPVDGGRPRGSVG